MSTSEDPRGLDSLQFAIYNPRDISEHDFKALKRSMAEFGDLSGVVKNIQTGNLVGGHQRVRAFQQAKDAKIHITNRFDKPNSVGTIARGYIEIAGLEGEEFSYREVDWPLEREQAANIAANRIQGQFNIDALAKLTAELHAIDPDLVKLTGQTQKEIDQLLDLVGVKNTDEDDDDAPAVAEGDPVSKRGQVYMLGRHFLMCGDATEIDDVEKLMAGHQADMIWTDPPYNVEYEGKTADKLTIQNDKFDSSESFYQFLFDAFANMAAITKAGSPIYICHADSEGLNFRKAMLDAGFLLKQCLIWNKNTMVLGRQDYQWKHEPILYGWKEGAAHYFVEDRSLTTVWEFDKPAKSEDHPTMKPVKLVTNAIANSSRREAIVVDLFGGSGSCLAACEKIDRTCYTMELDPKYCDVIRKRFAKMSGHEDQWEAFTPALVESIGEPVQ